MCGPSKKIPKKKFQKTERRIIDYGAVGRLSLESLKYKQEVGIPS